MLEPFVHPTVNIVQQNKKAKVETVYSGLQKHLFPLLEYAFALPLVKMRVLSKGMVSFLLKLKALWKYIKTKKNIKVLRVYLNCTLSAKNVNRTVRKTRLKKSELSGIFQAA